MNANPCGFLRVFLGALILHMCQKIGLNTDNLLFCDALCVVWERALRESTGSMYYILLRVCQHGMQGGML